MPYNAARASRLQKGTEVSPFGRIRPYARLAWGLKDYLGAPPLALEPCRQLVREGLVQRERNLLRIVERAVFRNPVSPYRELLALAGCEYGDFERMVHASGVEATLHKLRGEGVYLTHEEFKGKRALVRGGRHLRFQESDLDNPLLGSEFEIRTSGSRSAGTRVKTNLGRLPWPDRLRYIGRAIGRKVTG